MHINATWVSFPFLEGICDQLPRWRMVLLNPQIAHGMACRTNGCKELWSAVEQGLAPLGMAGAHNQRSAPQRQWLAMAGEGIAGQFRPVLPERSQ